MEHGYNYIHGDGINRDIRDVRLYEDLQTMGNPTYILSKFAGYSEKRDTSNKIHAWFEAINNCRTQST